MKLLLFVVELVTAASRGRVEERLLAKVVEKHRPSVKMCYLRASRHDPTLVAKLMTKLSIEATGRVTSVTFAETSVGAAELGPCLVESIQRWEFFPALKSYEYEFPIIMMRQ